MNENDKHEAFEAIVQAELYREVVDIYAEPENFPREEASEHAEKILRLIDEAVAARDAEIREALGAVPWNSIATDVLIADEYGGNYDDLLRQVTDAIWEGQEAALEHIGLAEGGAER